MTMNERQIRDLIGTQDADTIAAIENYMAGQGFDFSEATQEEFNEAALAAANQVLLGDRVEMFEIRRSLVISTAHITEATRDLLDATCHKALDELLYDSIAGEDPYGWDIYVHPQDELDEEARHFKECPELLPIFKLTRALDCASVRIDRDGPILEHHLETFDW